MQTQKLQLRKRKKLKYKKQEKNMNNQELPIIRAPQTNAFSCIDLFCGSGGLSAGFEKAGMSVILAYDNWDVAIQTYNQNNKGHIAKNLDLIELSNTKHEELKNIKRIKPFIIAGGPPCQDFSSAGKRNGNGKRGNLTPLFAKIVAHIKPMWFVMENVNTIKSVGEQQLSKAKEILQDAGYGITISVLCASQFGIPQYRKRLFMIGRLNGKDNELLEHLNQQKKQQKNVRQYFKEINIPLKLKHYYRHPRSYARRGVFSVEELSPTIRGVNRPIPPSWPGHNGDTTRNMKEVRQLTSEERAIIQTYPSSYNFLGNKAEVEQQIGNSVPPQLAEAVARAIINFEKRTLIDY